MGEYNTRHDEGLTIEIQLWNSLRGQIYIINAIDKIKIIRDIFTQN